MSPFVNRAISASAGTGKTFRLAHRYIGLVASGVSPDRICALTFSRKAASEIFDKIVDQLCAASTDAGRRAQTRQMIAGEGFPIPPDDSGTYLACLRGIVDHTHRLHIGTLDSFILGIVRAFPLELGIPPDTQPIDGDGGEAAALRRQILTQFFNPLRPRPAADAANGTTLLQALRQARHGQVGKRLDAVLDELITTYSRFFKEHPPLHWKWGDPDAVWAGNEQWWVPPGAAPLPDSSTLGATLEARIQPPAFDRRLIQALQKIVTATLSESWADLQAVADGPVFSQLLAGAASETPPEITYYKKTGRLPDEIWQGMRRLLAHTIAREAERLTERTRGLRDVLDIYEALYAEAVHAGGSFTFEDLSRLLGPGGRRPSRRQGATEEDRLYIDFRLDGRLDHWLLDEFQDTSDAQWDALENLVDEVVQDEVRSFFYVGDVKQSIYGWRGGNHRLFHTVRNRYAEMGERAITLEPMSRCHRSLPAVIEAVNRVFDTLDDWNPGSTDGHTTLRPAALEAFQASWTRHESARINEGEGYAALIQYPRDGQSASGSDETLEDESEEKNSAMFKAVAAIIRRTEPTRRGLTTAVLVRSNPAGRACVNTLRRELPDVPVIHEGKGGIVDNPVVTVLLALIQFAAHPADTVSCRHLQMSPLADQPLVTDMRKLPDAVLGAVHTDGFAGTLRDWGRRLGPLDAFGRQRLDELLAAAEQFDATGTCDPDAFCDFIAAHQVKASAAPGTIRVMTVHQSKGLGFDLVIVPFSKTGKTFEKPGDPGLLAGSDWVLMPPVSTLVDAMGDSIRTVLDDERATANFSQLCVLYVALTRAQQALYLVVPEPPKTQKSFRESDLLRDQLAPGAEQAVPFDGGNTLLAEIGDSNWHSAFLPETGRDSRTALIIPPPLTSSRPIPRLEPSKERDESRPFPAKWLFDAEAGAVMAFGSAIHRLFQAIEWLDGIQCDTLIGDWRAASTEPPALLDDVETQFRLCLESADVRSALLRPVGAPHADVWREAPFQLVLDHEGNAVLTSGRFDRVVIERDERHQPVRATLYDFKSNRIATQADMRETAAGYALQMRLYARAVARLLELPADRVATRLIFTRKGRVWTV